MEPIIEAMTRLVVHPVDGKPWKEYVIRMWRRELAFEDGLCDRTKNEAVQVIIAAKTSDKYVLARKLLRIDRMNAVEVLDETSNGCILYKDRVYVREINTEDLGNFPLKKVDTEKTSQYV